MNITTAPSFPIAVLRASRPRTLLTGMGPVFLGTALAVGPHTEPTMENFTIFTLCIFVTCLMQAGANLVNDVKDFQNGTDTEMRLGPPRAVQQGWLTVEQGKKAYICCFIMALLAGQMLVVKGGLPIFVTGLLCIAAAYLYTGGKYSLSRAGLGEVTALIFFGPVAVLGTYYLHTEILSTPTLLWSLGPGLTAAALMAINNYRDRNEDGLTGKNTLATRLSEKNAKRLPLFFLGGSLIIMAHFGLTTGKIQSMLGFTALALLLLFRRVWPPLQLQGKELNKALGGAASFSFWYCLFFSLLVLA